MDMCTHHIDPADITVKGEHSDRGQYVTNQVALWICNDGDYYPQALDLARKFDTSGNLAAFLIRTIQAAPRYKAPWHIAEELSPNDLRTRVNWVDVRYQLL